MNLKEKIQNQLLESVSDYGSEEVENVLTILKDYDDNLNGLKKWDKVIICRLLDDRELIEEIEEMHIENEDLNPFD